MQSVRITRVVRTLALSLTLVLGALAPARAETKRIAVVIGNNAGSGDQAPLRFAEVDAGKIGRVLVELGGVEPEDLFLLQGKNLSTLDATLERARAKVNAYQQSGLHRVVVIFYYSGHSDGVALELGRERFTFAALRKWLQDTGAEVRVGLIDSCKSGALIEAKGGTPGPAFQIRLTDDLSSTGEALLTSSAANENALESKEIGGSFFTHHLVSGLRGAADASGDARVTLSEAYQYAYKHTISTSGATLAGPQHPAYDFRLSGQGELILTELAQPTAALSLPDGFDRALVIDTARDQVIAELGRGAPGHVAVMPGRYGVRAWKAGQTFEGRVFVNANAVRGVRWDELTRVALVTPVTKGGDELAVTAPPPSAPGRFAIGAALSMHTGIAEDLRILGGVRVSMRSPRASGRALELDVTTAGNGIVRETSVFVLGAYRFGTGERFRAWIGGEAGIGAIVQASTRSASSGALAAAPSVGLSIGITQRIALALDARLSVTALIKDGDPAIESQPGGTVGLIITP